MTIQSNGKVMILAKNSRPSQDGRQTFYNFAIMIDGEAGNVSCTEEAYGKAATGVLNGVVYAFNDKYKSFRIVDIVPESSVPGNADSKPDKPSGK